MNEAASVNGDGTTQYDVHSQLLTTHASGAFAAKLTFSTDAFELLFH